MIKVKEQKKGTGKFTGLSLFKVKAINPTRKELNKLLGKEDEGEDEIEYLYTNRDNKNAVRLSFWLYSENLKRYFVHTISIVDEVRKSAEGLKTQYINDVCFTSWADAPENLQDWFVNFLDKDKKPISSKTYREALVGEEELAALMRNWISAKWSDPETSVIVDMKRLFKGDFSELQKIIGSGVDTKFVGLLGVRTDSSDIKKQYQHVYGKSFLPGTMWNDIVNGFKFTNSYTTQTWDKFDKKVNNGQYGFNCFFEMKPATEYDPADDISLSEDTKVKVAPDTSDY